jgi:hypothetical protein
VLLPAHADGFHVVFALGGDGTVMEVAGALSGGDTPIGVLAGGTGNLIARALGIPLSVKRAVPALLDGGELRIDLGRFDSGRRFAIAAGVGIDAAMVADAGLVEASIECSCAIWEPGQRSGRPRSSFAGLVIHDRRPGGDRRSQ